MEISVIIPVYNSEKTISRLVNETISALKVRDENVQIVLVNDGSEDHSHSEILQLLKSGAAHHIKYIQLSRNFGEHNAVMCGLVHADGDVAVIIDDDFQNPPSEIIKLIERLDEGYDVVYSYYEFKKHSPFRNIGSKFNDIVAQFLLKKPRGLYLSSFKVMNRFLIDVITKYEGPYPYIDGIILRTTTYIGTRLCDHDAREEGNSNYTLRKLISLWLNMFTSFSISPLRLSAYLGILMSAIGFLLGFFFIISWFSGGILSTEIPKGWASLIVTFTTFGGIQMLVLGLIGEYLGRVFMTQNNHPQFVVRRVLNGLDHDG